MAVYKVRLRSPFILEETGSTSSYKSADLTIQISSVDRYVISKDTDSAYKVRFEISELIRDYLEISWDGATLPYSSQVTTASLSIQFFDATKIERGSGSGSAIGAAIPHTVYGFDSYSGFIEGANKQIVSGGLMQSNTVMYLSETETAYVPSESSNVITYTSVSTSDTSATIGGIPVTFKRLCEPIYSLVKIIFINKFGAFQEMWFNKKSTNSISLSDEKYQRNIMSGTTYSVTDHQTYVYNKQARENMIINTGFVEEGQFEPIQQLLLSEQVWAKVGTSVLPVIITTSNMTKKTVTNEKVINYTLELEYAFDILNSVR
jgi:hypothetical protein